jgi:predicted AlkP superfamily phosphohydrolase/phosphomutase
MSSEPRRRALVLGLDGASFGVLDPLLAAGRLPNLASWRRAGVAKPLASTVPPMSFPAWSSFLTGLGPGGHGLFDFTQKLPGAYRLRFANATHRRGATLLGRASRAGRRVLALGIPATFPPEPLDGLLVSGFDAPVSSGTDARSASDPALYAAVAARAGAWKRPDLDEGAHDPGFHERAVATLCARVESKTRFALEALAQLERAGGRPDLGVVVFAESDTVAHHYWRDHDPLSPRHDPSASAARRGAVAAVYERLDAACGALRQAFGEDALCVVLSDHGSGGASHRVVHLNRRLAECGLLRRSPGGGRLEAAARAARALALRALPPGVAEAVFRRARGAAARLESAARFAGFDWKHSQAFSEEANTQPGVWINLRGREAQGCVAPADYERVRDAVIEALCDWKLPGGAPVVARARRREQVYAGPCVERAPDVVVELAQDAGYGLCLVPTPWSEPGADPIRTLSGEALAGGRGRGTNGTHRPDGIWIATGPGAERLDLAAAPALEDVAPTLLRHLGVAWDGDLDGVSLLRAEYGPAEEARVAARLRALGYLD